MKTSVGILLALSAAAVLVPNLAVADPRWHGDIRRFERHDFHYWRGGYWHHGPHDGHFGWWWVVGGVWYFYPEPVYPYPNPYTPPVMVMPQADPPVIVAPQVPPASAGPAPTQSWYYCERSRSYYPYVATCEGGWKQVPVTPPAGAGQ